MTHQDILVTHAEYLAARLRFVAQSDISLCAPAPELYDARGGILFPGHAYRGAAGSGRGYTNKMARRVRNPS